MGPTALPLDVAGVFTVATEAVMVSSLVPLL